MVVFALGQAARDGFMSPNGHAAALLLRLAQAHHCDGLRKRSAGVQVMDWSGVGHLVSVWEDAHEHRSDK